MDSFKEEEIKATEHFDFGGIAEGTKIVGKKNSRNVRQEVTNKPFEPEEVVDAYERSRGIVKPKKKSLEEFEYRNIILEPSRPKDEEMLNTLLNDPDYVIISYRDNWTPQGSYVIFIIYGKKKSKNAEEK